MGNMERDVLSQLDAAVFTTAVHATHQPSSTVNFSLFSGRHVSVAAGSFKDHV